VTSIPRHQCLIYRGAPSLQLASLALHIRRRLAENYRCVYFNSPAMVDGIRAYLTSSGLDVSAAVVEGRLILSSGHDHLVDDGFDPEHMLTLLKEAHDKALADGYAGLFATGDMAWEFGPARDFTRLEEYERALDQFLAAHPTMCGVCQYHADVLPGEALQTGLMVHPGIYEDESRSRVNPRYLPA
jgi:hypothetical protein